MNAMQCDAASNDYPVKPMAVQMQSHAVQKIFFEWQFIQKSKLDAEKKKRIMIKKMKFE